MKLVNKNTTNIKVFGEIVPCNEYGCIAVKTDQGVTWYYRSLAELNEEWEDYEEPKEYWCVDWTGGINHITVLDGVDEYEENKKQIGNYFETKEEAEKAVEKLKAWKRLKDKGFRFTGYDTNYGHHRASFIFEKEAWATETEPDLDLLFGGEE